MNEWVEGTVLGEEHVAEQVAEVARSLSYAGKWADLTSRGVLGGSRGCRLCTAKQSPDSVPCRPEEVTRMMQDGKKARVTGRHF